MTLRIVGGQFKGRILKSPQTDKTRPTTSMLREAVFNICQAWTEGARFLDIFAGSGAMGFEALSRGASLATFIEKDRTAAQCIRDNAALLSVQSQVQVFPIDAKQALPKLLHPYDLIYLDPPYDKDIPEILRLVVEYKLLAPEGLLLLEERFNSKQTPTCMGLTLKESRRYGIAHLHLFCHSAIEKV